MARHFVGATALGRAAARQWLEVAERLCARLGASVFAMQARLGWARLLLEFEPGAAPRAPELLSQVRTFARRQGIGLLEIAVQRIEGAHGLEPGAGVAQCVCAP